MFGEQFFSPRGAGRRAAGEAKRDAEVEDLFEAFLHPGHVLGFLPEGLKQLKATIRTEFNKAED